jgi:hypothetical protein
MTPFPDPRRYPLRDNPAGEDAESARSDLRASQHDTFADRVAFAARLLELDREVELRRIIDQAASPAESRAWHDAVDTAITSAASAGTAQVRLFAIPVLIVSAGTAGQRVPAALSDASALQTLLHSAGALGPTRNFGLSDALTGDAALETVPWTKLYRLATGDRPMESGDLALPPEPVVLRGSREQIDLRFLPAAVLLAAGAPAFPETAGAIGRWGMAFTRTLAQQLAIPGVTILPIPRSPMSFPRALRAGRFALRELGFQLFLSDALRRVRTRFGEPDVTVASYEDGSVRVRLSSTLEPSFLEEDRWALDPADDLEAVSASIFELLAEVRLPGLTVLHTVQKADVAH